MTYSYQHMRAPQTFRRSETLSRNQMRRSGHVGKATVGVVTWWTFRRQSPVSVA